MLPSLLDSLHLAKIWLPFLRSCIPNTLIILMCRCQAFLFVCVVVYSLRYAPLNLHFWVIPFKIHYQQDGCLSSVRNTTSLWIRLTQVETCSPWERYFLSVQGGGQCIPHIAILRIKWDSLRAKELMEWELHSYCSLWCREDVFGYSLWKDKKKKKPVDFIILCFCPMPLTMLCQLLHLHWLEDDLITLGIF